MARMLKLWLAFAALSLAQDATEVSSSGFDYVNPLIGTTAGGHVFPGATLPFGMAKAGPDVTNENQGGFSTGGSPVYGFSHMHDSGTGGSPSLGNFPIFPFAACPGNDPTKCTFGKTQRAEAYDASTIKASPGYFSLTLTKQKIKTEMTVTNHTALYRFTFPDSKTSNPVMMLELIDLPQSFAGGRHSVDAKSGRMTGNGTFSPSFGEGQYSLNYCADFSGSAIKKTGSLPSGQNGDYVQFNAPINGTILARVGVSFISAAQACSNAEKEIPNFDFAGVQKAAENSWKDKFSVLSVDMNGIDTNILQTFWSGVYRSMISPQDYTGENPLWRSSEPYYDSYYCIWDSFRSIHQLITLLDPHSQTLMVRSLIDIYRHEGKLPDCRMSLCKGYTQGGSNADVVLADSYLKGIKDGVDWATGYAAVVSDAEDEPPNWDIEGRGGLASWKTLGYIPKDDNDVLGTGSHTRSVSRTMEYAYDDFCIAQMAKALGHGADFTKYIGRSNNWKNVYSPNQTSTVNGVDSGFKGFVQPRNTDKSFAFQDPLFCSPLMNFDKCYLGESNYETYEGSCWLYTFFVPGDMATLVKTLGGADTFNKRLDYMHDKNIVYIGDEQGFLTVFQYHFAGRPGLSSKRAHYYIPSQFNDTNAGIPGNDDSGAMGSFAVFTMMGVFPNPGQNVYFITPPFFREVSITNRATGKVATVRNINFDTSYKNIYIQSAKLNGQTYTKNWIDHSFFLNGGVLELTLGPAESSWGQGAGDLPPSLSTGGPNAGVGQ